MTARQSTVTENFNLNVTPSVETKGREKPQKPGVIKAASVIMYIMACLFVLAVFAGKPAAVIFIPLAVYLAYGLSILKASARIGTIAFACFGLFVNLSAYIASKFTLNTVFVDIAFYVVILILLLSPPARNAGWKRKSAA